MSEEDIANALNTVNQCLQVIGQRLDAIEQYVQELPIHDKILYKPKNHPDYLNIKENYDEIYSRLEKLENGM
tara:strand:- start:535 stop:750 length:216 start_codon:yes stop_codon:yes gene_type:complete